MVKTHKFTRYFQKNQLIRQLRWNLSFSPLKLTQGVCVLQIIGGKQYPHKM